MTIEVIMKNQLEDTINENYDLISTTLGELREKLLVTQQNKQYSSLNIDVFNKESSFVRSIDSMIEHEKYSLADIFDHFFDSTKYNQEIQDVFDKKQHFYRNADKEDNIDYNFILGSTNIDIEEDENGQWYLLDGFRRVFVNKDFDNKKILIRKFKKLSNVKWLEYMFVANKWKQMIDSSFTTILDRGFAYSLYHRSDIIVSLFSPTAFKSINQLFGICYYKSSDKALNPDNLKEYFDNNNEFFNDLLFIHNLDELLKRNKKFNLYANKKKTAIKNTFKIYEPYRLNIFSMIVGVIGEARKYEYNTGLERKQLNPNDYIPILEELFEDISFNKTLLKGTEIYVKEAVIRNHHKLIIIIRDFLLPKLFNYDSQIVMENVPRVKNLISHIN